ncbi:hypothetical protein G6F40_016589 [Rhizopus arrhizus]|nr:hypothetical protein G6F40_016589 [Rhizopus arrhizus]
MPATMAERSDAGMPDTSPARTPVSDSTRNTRPEMNTAPSACCHGRPAAPTTVKAKNAFRPMPGAMPTGKLAASAITAEPSAAARQVATKTASRSMPVDDRMSGLTKMMYDIVRKVVRPATISVRAVVPCSRSVNSFSSSRVPSGFAGLWGVVGRCPRAPAL